MHQFFCIAATTLAPPTTYCLFTVPLVASVQNRGRKGFLAPGPASVYLFAGKGAGKHSLEGMTAANKFT